MIFFNSLKFTFIFFIFMLASNAVFAAKLSIYEANQFKPALDEAAQRIQKLHGGRNAEDSTGGNVKVEVLENGGQGGSWRVMLGIGCSLLGTDNSVSNEYGKLMAYKSPSVVVNNRDSFLYVFKTQAIDDIHLKKVEEQIASRKKSLINEFKNTSVTVERGEDKMYQVNALVPFTGGMSESQVADRLTHYMRESEWLLCDIHTGVELSNANRWKELKGNITTLSKADLITLYPLFKETGYAVNNPDNPHGDWQMGGDDYKVWVENQNTQMKLWLRINSPYGNTTKETGDAIIAQIQTLPLAKGAASVEVSRDENDIWIGSSYPYAGMKGKEIEDTIQYFYYKYSPGTTKDVRKIVKKLQ